MPSSRTCSRCASDSASTRCTAATISAASTYRTDPSTPHSHFMFPKRNLNQSHVSVVVWWWWCRWSPHLHVLEAVHVIAYRPHTAGREQQPRDTYVRAQRTPYAPYQIDNEHCTSVAAGVQSHDVLTWYRTRSRQRRSLCTKR